MLYDLLEPYAGKLARTVLRGEGISNNPDLPDNSRYTGQAILSTVEDIPQPASTLYQPIGRLPFVTDEFKDLLMQSEETDPTPSCSMAEALDKQDLFINATLAQMGCSLLWSLLRNAMTLYRGFFVDLGTYASRPLAVA